MDYVRAKVECLNLGIFHEGKEKNKKLVGIFWYFMSANVNLQKKNVFKKGKIKCHFNFSCIKNSTNVQIPI